MSLQVRSLQGDSPNKRRRIEAGSSFFRLSYGIQRKVFRFFNDDELMQLRNYGPLKRIVRNCYAISICEKIHAKTVDAFSIRHTAQSFYLDLPPKNFEDPAMIDEIARKTFIFMHEFSDRCMTLLCHYKSTQCKPKDFFKVEFSFEGIRDLNVKYRFHSAIDPHDNLRDLCRTC